MLASFRNAHQSQSIVVCGCGHSLVALRQPNSFITIGVNDVGRLFQPDYLVVIDGREHLRDRFRYVETSQAGWIFTQRTNLGLLRSRIVNFRLGTGDGPESADAETLPFSRERLMTPHVAVCLALHMGARNIGLIGVDLTDHHFFASTGAHEWAPHLDSIDREFARLGVAALERGCRIFNLSEMSRLSAFPKMSVETFATIDPIAPQSAASERPRRIVSYATTPLVGRPALLARCINAQTPHRARCVWATDRYQTGVSFAQDVNWTTSPARTEAEIEAADVIVLHNGKVDERHRALIEGKPVVTVAHNYMANVDDEYVRRGFPGLVLGQYQPTLPEFRFWPVVPNPLPLWEADYRPAEKNPEITITYTPSDRHQVYPSGHPLYWHGKGYDATMRVLDHLGARYPIRLEVVRDSFLSHAEALRMKQRAHIVIDECVTGSYHRNSLEGLAAGCVVVNGVGLLPGVLDALRHCAEDRRADPFVHANLSTLEHRLRDLIELGPDLLTMLGTANRAWMERHWDFERQWDRVWRPAISEAIRIAAGRPTPPPHELRPAPELRAAKEQGKIELIVDAIEHYETINGRQRYSCRD
jgi:hypothetical protein